MKKHAPLILLALAALILTLLLIKTQQSHLATPDVMPTKRGSAVQSTLPYQPDIRSPRHRGPSRSAGLSQSGEPAEDRLYSSTVQAEIQAGETLVMGGYRLPDGSHEFTFLTPTDVAIQDGKMAIRLEAKTICISPEFARESGMDSLTTQYSKADQHAEAWSKEEVSSTLLDSAMANGTRMMSAPSITVIPGEPANISIGGENGSARHSIESTVGITVQGGFSIRSRVERTPAQSP